jgi:hypothetical protein
MTTQELARTINATHIVPCVTDRYHALFVPFTDKYGMEVYRLHYMVFANGEASLLGTTSTMIALPHEAMPL